jgi:hypothetical protein
MKPPALAGGSLLWQISINQVFYMGSILLSTSLEFNNLIFDCGGN